MLGKTAGGLLWMFRYLERSENIARLVETGQRIALTRPDRAENEWLSVLETAGARQGFEAEHDEVSAEAVTDWLLRAEGNSSSVMNCIEMARMNARMVRTALTREVWEAVNECWMTLRDELARKVTTKRLPHVLGVVRQRSAFVRGTLHGTMLRNEIYDFARLGTFLERADATARLLDVKYYVLLPTSAGIGSRLDNAQWETILRSVSAEGAFRMVHGRTRGPGDIARFLILDGRMPRSLAFCYNKIGGNLEYLQRDHGVRMPCHDLSDDICRKLERATIESIFEEGLHEFLQDFLTLNSGLAAQIERDYRFVE
ncbi:alpha-E domain-containing protein [Jannaschia ovalis]|uniref:Alpha-E domain-containing protein n=1 Tax=Jannaschia ovalis TaxID=3038773 RepID=A0ABY8LBZ7_9RHOB|nr:alpha-E domain-containing protein [Jannaschia sp. GRR-S6-38]WGH77713.1 alpha-E domain-containing protein [Jannaschia sp. GRR-S6-38]